METKKWYLENLDKATQTAQTLCDDLGALYAKTETEMEEMFFDELFKQAHEIRSKLVRAHNGAFKSEFSADYLNMVKMVGDIGNANDVDYLLNEAWKLKSFNGSAEIETAFAWDETPQGSEYWQGIYKQLKASKK